MNKMELSIVVPVYNEAQNVPVFLEKVGIILKQITESYEIIFSLDPSKDSSEDVILAQRAKDERIKLIKFSRRVGQPMAILAGMQYSSGNAVIVMDVDMQDPPELIIDMIAKWREGFDVVMAQRKKRNGETFIKKVIAKAGYSVIRHISEVPIPQNTGEFRLMSRRVVNEVVSLPESHGFLRGLVALVGFRQTTLLFDRPQRLHGDGNYNRFLGSLKIGFNGIFCFSTYALTLSTQMGFLIAGFSFLMGVAYLIMKLCGFPFPIGNPTVVILILFMGGVQLVSVGILGEYIGRIYDEVRRRPKFIVDKSIGFEI